jgi:predicted MPP superfamily phosphohydrolase
MLKFLTLAFGTLLSLSASAQSRNMDFEKYDPISTLVVPEHKVDHAKFPFIDVHNHQFDMGNQDLSTLIKDMDKLNMKVMVNLSGQGGNTLKKMMNNVRSNYPRRFIVFTNINFDGIGNEGWTQNAVKQLEEDVKSGANGLKIYKSLGFSVQDKCYLGKMRRAENPCAHSYRRPETVLGPDG